jgi:ribonucleoside-diphosphate reductase alpha chain
MGFADMLYQLGVPYNSENALAIADAVMKFINETAHNASSNLADEKGVFRNYYQSIYKDQEVKYRNATVTTIAPTGTISIIAGCSSGIEPLFALSFVRNVMDNDRMIEANPHFEKVAKERGFYSTGLMGAIARVGSIQKILEIPADICEIFTTAHDVSSDWHIKMQATFQKHTDNAVSKTVNLPHDATEKDVAKVYDLAFEKKIKFFHLEANPNL